MSVIHIEGEVQQQSVEDAPSRAAGTMDAVLWSLIVGIPALIGAEIWLVAKVIVP